MYRARASCEERSFKFRSWLVPKRLRIRDRSSRVVSMGSDGLERREVTEGRRVELSHREVRSGVSRWQVRLIQIDKSCCLKEGSK